MPAHTRESPISSPLRTVPSPATSPSWYPCSNNRVSRSRSLITSRTFLKITSSSSMSSKPSSPRINTERCSHKLLFSTFSPTRSCSSKGTVAEKCISSWKENSTSLLRTIKSLLFNNILRFAKILFPWRKINLEIHLSTTPPLKN